VQSAPAVEHPALRSASRSPGRQHYPPRYIPIRPGNPASHRGRLSHRVHPTPAVDHVAAAPIGEERQPARDIPIRPEAAARQRWRGPIGVYPSPAIQRVQMTGVIQRPR
jgi:hypothetical protein